MCSHEVHRMSTQWEGHVHPLILMLHLQSYSTDFSESCTDLLQKLLGEYNFGSCQSIIMNTLHKT